jgi:arsenate reductase-like glutaredoxin family protein
MGSKFGLFGDLDIQVSNIRRVVSNSNAILNNVKVALREKAISKGQITEERLCEIVQGIENDLDSLLNKE